MMCGCLSHNGFLTVRGYAEVAQREQQLDAFPEVGLTPREACVILDTSGSVSGARRDEASLHFVIDEELIDEQYRRFLEGSSFQEGSGTIGSEATRD